jgi:16S rRNA (uracil1498-N3)-methyltransferase
MTSKIRLFVDHPLAPAQSLPLTREHAHYLFSVMRQNVGDRVLVFNGQDGEWLAEITQAGKKSGALSCLTQSKALRPPPDLWLLFRTDQKNTHRFYCRKSHRIGCCTDLSGANHLYKF